MTGARSFAAIGEYARDKGRLVLDTLGADGAFPHAATIRRVLVEIDPVGLQEAITAWSLAQRAVRDRPPSDVPTRERRPVIACTCSAVTPTTTAGPPRIRRKLTTVVVVARVATGRDTERDC
jgi:hypothetical protein